MRRIHVDHCRERHSLKRGGGALKVTLMKLRSNRNAIEELLALDEALDKLGRAGPRKSQIVENCATFGGLTSRDG